MKLSILENQVTRERYVCRDLKQIQSIDGEEYVRVQRWVGGGGNLTQQLHEREFLIRRSALKQVKV